MKTKTIYITLKTLTLSTVLLLVSLTGKAQLNPLQSMYFQNQYLYNPAYAGMTNALNLNLDYRQAWSSFPGTPKTEAFTADYGATDRVGLGVNVYNDVAGLITQTKVVGTYAYHLPLGANNQKLNFGVSFGVNNSHVNPNDVNGDQGDAELAQYNQLKPYIDGDFGIAYTSDGFNLSGAIPNLKSAFFKSSVERFDADRLVFVAIASYKIPLASEDRSFSLEPLAGYRVVKGYKNIVDAGFNFGMQNSGVYLEGVYHSSNSLSVGFGLDEGAYAINFDYNLETGQLATYTNGAFELGIKLRLFGKKAR